MGRLRLTKPARARLVALAGGATAVGGVWEWLGVGIAAVVAGISVAAYGLLLMDADEEA